ncbi:zinc finger protein 318-like isoform X2 [Varanus komodoensis]|nr:zinc finger protein 318-like isoform X2 [Varanus komodoensis]
MDRDDLADGAIFSRSLLPSRSLVQYPSLEENSSSCFKVRCDVDYHSRDVFICQSDYSMNYDHLRDQPRETDTRGEVLGRSLYLSEDRGREPKHPRYDGLLDRNMEPQCLLSEAQTYYAQSLSGGPSPTYLDEDFLKLVSARRKREELERSQNLSQELPSTGSINPAQSFEPQYHYSPAATLAMPKKSILKKQVDGSLMQNSGDFLKQKELHELTVEPVNRHSESVLPRERASQDASVFSCILDIMAESASAQKRRCSFLDDIEDEEKFLYGDEVGSIASLPSAQKPMLTDERECVPSQRVTSPSHPNQSLKIDTSEEARLEYEKIHDLLKTIGLDIGVAEIGKLAARTKERLRGKKRSCSPEHHLVASHKPEFQKRHQGLSDIHSLEANQEYALSPSDSFPLYYKDKSSVSNLEHNKSNAVWQDSSAGTSEQPAPSITLIPSAPPFPDLCPTPTFFPPYVPHFSSFTASHTQNYPLPTIAFPGCNTYGLYTSYATSDWPMLTQQTVPGPSAIQGPVQRKALPNPKRPNLRALERAPPSKVTPKKKRGKRPTTSSSSDLLQLSSQKSDKEKISDERNRTSQKQQIIQERAKLKDEQEVQQKKLHYLRIELNRLSKQQEGMLRKKRKEIDPLLVEVNRQKENIANKVAQLEMNVVAAEKKQSELDKVAQILGINIEKSWILSSENKDSEKSKSEK